MIVSSGTDIYVSCERNKAFYNHTVLFSHSNFQNKQYRDSNKD
jgi:hypothetical protein